VKFLQKARRKFTLTPVSWVCKARRKPGDGFVVFHEIFNRQQIDSVVQNRPGCDESGFEVM